MKLYIAKATCSLAAQIIANELGLNPELVHYNVFDKSTSNSDDFAEVNPLGYVPVLQLGEDQNDLMTETTVIVSYLADLHPEAGLIPLRGTRERLEVEQLLTFTATEVAQKHIPLMRKLMSEEGTAWTLNKLVTAYSVLDERLADGRPFLMGDKLTVVDAYVWATMWHERSGAQIQHLENVMAHKARMEAHPSVRKALADEARMVAIHEALATA